MNGDPAPALSRMEHFERGCALILARLYQSFPLETNIRVQDLESDVGGEVERIHAATMEFLSIEEYLRYGTARGPRARGLVYNTDFHKVILTAKGLAVLDAIPSVLQRHEPESKPVAADVPTKQPDQRSRGKRLIEALKTGATDAARTVVREVISESLKKAMGG